MVAPADKVDKAAALVSAPPQALSQSAALSMMPVAPAVKVDRVCRGAPRGRAMAVVVLSVGVEARSRSIRQMVEKSLSTPTPASAWLADRVDKVGKEALEALVLVVPLPGMAVMAATAV